MYRLTKSFTFSASHAASHLEDENDPCTRLHGHNYVVEVVVEGALLDPKTQMVLNLHVLKPFKEYLDTVFDHRHLNETLLDLGGASATTSERLAEHFYGWCHSAWPEVKAVIVRESPTMSCEYRP
jgi:6-pyruvoyltetrahydropterin/6-carboxytetrahydropterin synthase